MNEPTAEQYAKIAMDASLNELLLECGGDLEEFALGLSTFPASAVEHWKALKESLDAYAKDGRETGDFLRAVLENDLKEAFGRADCISRWLMFPLVKYVYNDIPAACQGSPEKVRGWLDYKAAERDSERRLKSMAARAENRAQQDLWQPGHIVAYVPYVGEVEIGEFKCWGRRDGVEDRTCAFVFYHLGDTAANTSAEELFGLETIHAGDMIKLRGGKDGRKLAEALVLEKRVADA